ncbi:phosphatase PAP2 family protein [Paenibacillus sp. CGMCC 1.16610]|uniref:Phosphatase PAP2 family protein n=1 Tax=Paenibacillus anseongense TaxID=2682845 RepID=A0ABW9UBK3_9BACL|nr:MULTISPECIES: phosphatase PAP2 family protein [Paenibacillus]MBA2937323.1 phosphatase PAP2 family protein [Paenibacillus sp. CGMCC 1.16610]MVQ36381.1 phosphatase PAP2 family protein [Paenibacillus anseongense]
MQWLRQVDHNIFVWCNQRVHHFVLDWLFGLITHMGGASFTILCTILVIWLAPNDWESVGLQILAALTFSHVIAVIIKKKMRRNRPFRVLQQVRVGRFPLKDYSFPSGHTTAIFAFVTPFLFLSSQGVALLLIIFAGLVAFSRVYWGYHYPTDCVAGGTIGMGSALLVVYLTNITG